MFLVSGATMVNASLVKDSQYTQENIKIICVNGTVSSWRLAKVWIHAVSFLNCQKGRDVGEAFDKLKFVRWFLRGSLALRENWMICGWPVRSLSQLNDVNYEIVVPKNKRKMVHINNLKTWVEQQARVLQIVCAAEEAAEESSEAPAKLKLLGNAMPAQGQLALISLLNQFGDVMSNLPRNTTLAVHQIDTGTALPIRLAPCTQLGRHR